MPEPRKVGRAPLWPLLRGVGRCARWAFTGFMLVWLVALVAWPEVWRTEMVPELVCDPVDLHSAVLRDGRTVRIVRSHVWVHWTGVEGPMRGRDVTYRNASLSLLPDLLGM